MVLSLLGKIVLAQEIPDVVTTPLYLDKRDMALNTAHIGLFMIGAILQTAVFPPFLGDFIPGT